MSTIMYNEKLEITLDSHSLSKGVPCIMKLHSDALKGKEINIGNQNQPFSTPTKSRKKKMGQIVDNGSSLTYSIFWKRDAKSNESLPLLFCCVDCGLECVEFRCLSVKFSREGKCEVPITLWCSPSHDKRPKTTVLVLKIEITSNEIYVQGEVPIPFKKYTKTRMSVESEVDVLMQLQQQIEILNKTLPSINQLIDSLLELKNTELESAKRSGSSLIDTEKNKRRKTREEEEEEAEQEEGAQQATVNAVVRNTFEIPYTTTHTNTTTVLPTYTPYGILPETANTTNTTNTTNTINTTTPPPFSFQENPDYLHIPPEMFSFFFGPN